VIGVAGTIALMQNLAETITGIKYAPQVGYPPALDTAKLPAVLTFASDALTTPISNRVTATSASFRKIERAYSLTCYVDPIGQSSARVRMDLCIELLDAFSDVFVPNRHLAETVRILDTRDTGIVSGANVVTGNADNLVYNGQPYAGFVMSITVIEMPT
jgi:hypothetical protein